MRRIGRQKEREQKIQDAKERETERRMTRSLSVMEHYEIPREKERERLRDSI